MTTKSFFILCFVFLFPAVSHCQKDGQSIFNTHKFSCEEGSTTLEINLCSLERLNFADSLLNLTYRRVIRSLDKDIAESKKAIAKEQIKKDMATIDKESIAFMKKDMEQTQRLKDAIVKSQQQWIKLRDLNGSVEDISHEGGTARVSYVNESMLADTLERIKKLESFGIYTDQ